jgi:hypothetical protein
MKMMERSELERRAFLRGSVGLPPELAVESPCRPHWAVLCPMYWMHLGDEVDPVSGEGYRNRWDQVLPMAAGEIQLLKVKARWYEYLVEASGPQPLPCWP